MPNTAATQDMAIYTNSAIHSNISVFALVSPALTRELFYCRFEKRRRCQDCYQAGNIIFYGFALVITVR